MYNYAIILLVPPGIMYQVLGEPRVIICDMYFLSNCMLIYIDTESCTYIVTGKIVHKVYVLHDKSCTLEVIAQHCFYM